MKDANEKPGPKQNSLVRPKRLPETPVPPIPKVDETSELASTQYSAYRTGLSNHRTGLSEHRTSLSEYRTDLSMHRTDLSTDRTEMSMRRTGMSFQRTRMSAERTLMSVIRTSLSLIGFGFTIYQVFEKLRDAGTITHARAFEFRCHPRAARHRDADHRHRLPHPVHARSAPRARRDARGWAHLRPE